MKVTYVGGAPAAYRCATCKAKGVKLWREYQTGDTTLACAKCACKEQSKDGKTYSITQNAAGRVCVTTTYDAELAPELHKVYGGRDVGGDQIGWRVPAVPSEDGKGYWGYTSVPPAGCFWWNRLPLEN